MFLLRIVFVVFDRRDDDSFGENADQCVPDCRTELAAIRLDSVTIGMVHRAIHGLNAEHHVRMLFEILVEVRSLVWVLRSVENIRLHPHW